MPRWPGKAGAAFRWNARTAELTMFGLAALVAFLPFARGLLMGRCLYFRDLARYFFPVRRFVTEGLQHGELRLWNPFVHEGVSGALLFYPFDALQLLRNDEWTCSLLLALHVALAAVTMTALLRSLDLGRTAAAGGGILYALSGFGLSLVNLDIFTRAYAWAPLTVLALRRAAAGHWGAVAWAAVVCGIALSTLSTEIVAQGLFIGVLLSAWPPRAGKAGRLAAALALGAGLAAAPLLLQARLIPGSARGALLPTETSLEESVAPLVFLQTVVANLFGDLNRIGIEFWGGKHFNRGFPYVLSLYAGVAAVGLAAAGLADRATLRKRLIAVLVAGLLVCLGGHVGLDALLRFVPAARLFRYPVKAFFSVQFALTMMAGAGLDGLARNSRRAWATLCAVAGAVGGGLLATAMLGLTKPEVAGWLFRGFFPDGMGMQARSLRGAGILLDAAMGAGVGLVLVLVGAGVLLGRVRAAAGAGLACGLMTADLLRAGAGLNPMVTADYYRLTEQAASAYREIALQGGRVFTCDLLVQESYVQARMRSGVRSDSYVFAALIESMTPFTNVPFHVRTALGTDLYGLVPVERTLGDAEISCQSPETLHPALRIAGVTHVVSADALAVPWLHPVATLRPQRLAPLELHLYRLDDPLPRFEVARQVRLARGPDEARAMAAEGLGAPGSVVVEGPAPAEASAGDVRLIAAGTGLLQLEVRADAASLLVVREGYDPAWRATVNGALVPVWRANGRHLAVPTVAGRAVVDLRHRPRELRVGAAAGAVSAAAALALFVLERRRRRRGRGGAVDSPAAAT